MDGCMRRVVLLSKVSAVLAVLVGSVAAFGQAVTIPANWVGSWATSQQLPEPQNSLSADDLQDATLRQIVHLSVGGPELRVHVSNAFGTAPLHLTAVHVARLFGCWWWCYRSGQR